MIINASLLIGEHLDLIEQGYVVVKDSRIVEVGDGFRSDGINLSNFLVMPALINAHTHIGDSFAKEAVLGLDLKKAVGREGMKWRLYENSRREDIIRCMRDTIQYMLNSGTGAFADFREGGMDGVGMLRSAVEGIPINARILGRDVDITECDGLGINIYQVDQIPEDRKGRLIAIHAGEADGEIEVALRHNPDVIIHFTKAKDSEIQSVAERGVSVVLCPRSNAVLGVGIPPVKRILDSGIDPALGTDNVMINSPNLFREMEFLFRISYLTDPIPPREILRMATVNGAKVLGINSGIIENGKNADLIFIDKNAPNLRDSRNIIAAIVHRCDPENVRRVMIDGKFVVDKDKKNAKDR